MNIKVFLVWIIYFFRLIKWFKFFWQMIKFNAFAVIADLNFRNLSKLISFCINPNMIRVCIKSIPYIFANGFNRIITFERVSYSV